MHLYRLVINLSFVTQLGVLPESPVTLFHQSINLLPIMTSSVSPVNIRNPCHVIYLHVICHIGLVPVAARPVAIPGHGKLFLDVLRGFLPAHRHCLALHAREEAARLLHSHWLVYVFSLYDWLYLNLM